MTRGFTHTLWIDTWFHTHPIWPTSWFHTHPHIYVLTLLTFKGRTSITTDPLKGVETEPPKTRTALRVSSGLRPRHKASPNSPFSQRQKQTAKGRTAVAASLHAFGINIQAPQYRQNRRKPPASRFLQGRQGVWCLGTQKPPYGAKNRRMGKMAAIGAKKPARGGLGWQV